MSEGGRERGRECVNECTCVPVGRRAAEWVLMNSPCVCVRVRACWMKRSLS